MARAVTVPPSAWNYKRTDHAERTLAHQWQGLAGILVIPTAFSIRLAEIFIC